MFIFFSLYGHYTYTESVHYMGRQSLLSTIFNKGAYLTFNV